MPNWCDNTLTFVNCEPKDWEPLLLNKDGEVDFNVLAPMPESLSIESGSTTSYALTYYLTERLTKPARNLKSLVQNMFDEHYDETVKKRLKEAQASGANPPCATSWDELYRLGEQYAHNVALYGVPTWYEWCRREWGTKWNASDTQRKDEDSIFFQTPWAPPVAYLGKLIDALPVGAEIEVFWIEEGGEGGHILLTRTEDGHELSEAPLTYEEFCEARGYEAGEDGVYYDYEGEPVPIEDFNV